MLDIIKNDVANELNKIEMSWNLSRMKAHEKDQDDSIWKKYAHRGLKCLENQMKIEKMEKDLEEKGSYANFFTAGVIEGAIAGTATAAGIVGVLTIASGMINLIKKRG